MPSKPTADETLTTPPETFPVSCEEYAYTTPGVGPIWGAGLAVFAGTEERTRAEWDALFAEFQDRPVQ